MVGESHGVFAFLRPSTSDETQEAKGEGSIQNKIISPRTTSRSSIPFKWTRGILIGTAVLLAISVPNRQSCCLAEDVVVTDDVDMTDAAAEDALADFTTDLAGDAMEAETMAVDDLDTKNNPDDAATAQDAFDSDADTAAATTDHETSAEAELDRILNMLEEEGVTFEEGATAAATTAEAGDETAAGVKSDTNAAAQAYQEQIGLQQQQTEEQQQKQQAPVQSGPFVDLFGDVLLSLEMVDETHAQVHQHYTNEVLSGKKVVGLYFSADW